jgi:hypothetical protein
MILIGGLALGYHFLDAKLAAYEGDTKIFCRSWGN